jgi:hypothetical protein
VPSSPSHFEQASQIVTEQMTRESIAYGDNAERHLAAFRPFAEAGFDDIYISQMGGSQPATAAAGFFSFYRGLLPELRKLHAG